MVAYSTLEASSLLLSVFLNIVSDSFSFTVVLRAILLPWSSFKLNAILKGTLLTSGLAAVLAGVLVPALEHRVDDIYVNELFSPLITIFTKVFVMCHALAEGTC